MKGTQFRKFRKQPTTGARAVASHWTQEDLRPPRVTPRRSDSIPTTEPHTYEPQTGIHRIGASVLPTVVVVLAAFTAHAQQYDPPIAPLVTNMRQPPGPDSIVTLDGQRDGLYQAFRTGPNRGACELKSIWLYARNARESRHERCQRDRHKIRTRRGDFRIWCEPPCGRHSLRLAACAPELPQHVRQSQTQSGRIVPRLQRGDNFKTGRRRRLLAR